MEDLQHTERKVTAVFYLLVILISMATEESKCVGLGEKVSRSVWPKPWLSLGLDCQVLVLVLSLRAGLTQYSSASVPCSGKMWCRCWRAVVLHRAHLALGISRKEFMCFLGIPSLLSRNSPLSFPGICTVLSRKCQLLLSTYISSSLCRIIYPHSFVVLVFFPSLLHQDNFPSIYRNCLCTFWKFPLSFPGINLWFSGILCVCLLQT